MPASSIHTVDVYPYRRPDAGSSEPGAGVEFLVLHRAAGTRYEGAWRMVGGKIEDGEAAWETARRECREETGQVPSTLWTIPSVNAFYEWQSDRVVLAPAFAAELNEAPVLDGEHDRHAWVSADEAARRLEWPEQQRLVRLASRLLSDGVPADLVVGSGK